MSPSEQDGLALGVRMLSLTRARHVLLPPNADPKTKVAVKFEAEIAGRRHQLVAYTKSRAGAWQAAIRWFNRLERGELR